jgi:hypothetical protein
MNETIEKIHSDLVVVDPVKLADMAVADLMALAKETNGRATKAAKQTLVHVGQTGVVLIELKNRLPHGNFMIEVKHHLDIDHRTASNYMLIARHFGNVSNLRGVRDALRYISDAARMAKDRESPPPALPTTTVLPEPPAASPRLPQITLDAEIVVHAQKVETPDEMFQRGLDSLQETMPREEFIELLETALAKSPEAERLEEPPAPAVAAPTASAAPSMIEISETTLAEILGLLPRLRPAEITELHRVIESRWMKGGRP